MAAPVVRLKRSSVAGKVPTTSDLDLGEIAINTHDGKAYFKKDDGTESIVEIGTGGGGGGLNGSFTTPKSLLLYEKTNTGNPASFDDVETRFQLRDSSGNILTVSNALYLAVSLNGVIQKPNSGVPSSPFEGFYVTSSATAGYDIVFGSAPPSGSNIFILLSGTFTSNAATSGVKILDDISADFDGTTTAFTLKYDTANYSPQFTQAVIVSLGGVVQIPTTAYSISGSTITFTSAPPASTTFHGLSFEIADSALPLSGGTITGDLTVEGNLTVEGTTTTIDTQNLLVEDKNIIVGNVTSPTDVTADGGGITLKGTTDKTITWSDTTNAWTSSEPLDLPAGAAATPSLFFGADVNTGLYSPGADQIAISTGGSERLRIESDGNIIFNFDGSSATGTSRFADGTAAAPGITFWADGGADTGIFRPGANILGFTTAGSERARIDSSGRLLVGTSSALNVDGNAGFQGLQVAGAGSTSCASLSRFTNNASSPDLTFAKSRGATVGTNTIVAANDDIGAIRFSAADGTTYLEAARILAEVDGTPGADQMPGRIIFSTNPGTVSATPVERLRITSDGKLGLGTSAPQTLFELSANNGSAASNTLRFTDTDTTTQTNQQVGAIEFFSNDTAGGPGVIGKIECYSGGTSGNGIIGIKTGYASTLGTRLTIDDAGNVGIGTTAPARNLHLASSGTNNVYLHFTHDGTGHTNADGVDLRHNRSTDNLDIMNLENAGITFHTNGENERLRITADGKVGIGTSTVNRTLTLYDATVPIIQLINSSSGTTSGSGSQIYRSSTGFVIEEQGALPIQFLVNGGFERARIDSSGRLLVGTASARTNFGATSAGIQLEGIDDTSRKLAIISSTSSNSNAQLILAAQRSGTVGGNTIVGNNANLGLIYFMGSDGTNFVPAALIQSETDNTPGAGVMPGRLIFGTNSGASGASPTEGLRIDSSQVVWLSNAFSSAANFATTGKSRISNASGTNTGTVGMESYGSTVATRHHISFSNPNGVVGSISTSANATAYNTSSDYRLKENVVPLTGAADRLNQLQVHRFNFIADPDKTVDGFIAHEAQVVVPECVTGTKDEVDDEGNPVYQGIDQSKLVPLLTAALQEALAKIETLEARLNAAGL